MRAPTSAPAHAYFAAVLPATPSSASSSSSNAFFLLAAGDDRGRLAA